MIGATSRHIKKVPFKLVSMTSFHSAQAKSSMPLGIETAAGDVRQHIDAAEALRHVTYRRLDVARHGHVGAKGQRPYRCFFDLGAYLLAAAFS